MWGIIASSLAMSTVGWGLSVTPTDSSFKFDFSQTQNSGYFPVFFF